MTLFLLSPWSNWVGWAGPCDSCESILVQKIRLGSQNWELTPDSRLCQMYSTNHVEVFYLSQNFMMNLSLYPLRSGEFYNEGSVKHQISLTFTL